MLGGLSRKEEKELGELMDDGEAALVMIGVIASPGRGTERAMSIEVDDSGARVPLLSAAPDEARLKTAVESELHIAFPSVPVDQVTILVECLWSHFDAAPIRDFVPLLVQKQAKEELLDHYGTRAEAVVPPPAALLTAHPWSVSLPPEGSTP